MEETKTNQCLDIYVINLKRRTDRKNFILKQFSNCENINIIFMEAIEHKPGSIGCFLSHQKCVEHAKNIGLKQIIVIEDDCLIRPDFYKRLRHIYDYLYHKDDWNLFLGGIHKTKQNNIIKKLDFDKETIYEVDYGSCFHMVIYNHTFYDKLLDHDPITDELNVVDVIWHEKYRLNALTCYPFLAYQKPSYSDLAEAETSSIRGLQITENRFKKFISTTK